MGVGLVLVASGCAFSDVRLQLPTSEPTHLSGGDQRQVLVVAPFADERAAKNRCGMQKNAYNVDTASALCTPEPPKWIADLLATQLRSAGFVVVLQGVAAKPGALVVNGALLKFFVEPVIGFTSITLETDVQIRLTVTSASGLLAERTFFSKGITSAQVSRAGNFETSVDTAAQQITDDMVAAIISLANHYPQLGAATMCPVAGLARTEEDGR